MTAALIDAARGLVRWDRAPAVLGGGRVIMVSMQIASNIELFFNWGAASALGVVLLLMTFAILFAATLAGLYWLCGVGALIALIVTAPPVQVTRRWSEVQMCSI